MPKDRIKLLNDLTLLFKSGWIKIGIDIEPRQAPNGDGQWNVTTPYIIIGAERIDMEEGRVELIKVM